MEELERKSLPELENSTRHPVVIILDDVRSMQNVGSVFRTADAFGIQSVYLCGITPTPPHRDIHKTALGATETVHWEYQADIEQILPELKQKGFRIAAVEQTQNSTLLQHVEFDKHTPIVLIFGNEVNGVSEKALKYCDLSIEIPQWGNKHSLNISVCMGVVCWHLIYQIL